MAIARWDPMQEMFPLREAMNRLFEASQVAPGGLFGPRSGIALDVYTEGDNYVVEAALPGLDPDAVTVEALGSQVTISGQYPATPEHRQYLLRELPTGQFQRTLTFPTEVDAAQAQGQYTHGVLRLTLPKAAHARPKRLALTAGR
ncbi:MAG TPA: Hsp20/alpha crystallin family protein [Chloroflexota bacterium]|nr:Hsp20/alpha crystallin family protein [Chloroflexota bacterium]